MRDLSFGVFVAACMMALGIIVGAIVAVLTGRHDVLGFGYSFLRAFLPTAPLVAGSTLLIVTLARPRRPAYLGACAMLLEPFVAFIVHAGLRAAGHPIA